MKSNPNLTKYLLWNAKDYFKEAESFVQLTDKFLQPSWFLWFEMIIQPIILIATCLYTRKLLDVLSLLGVIKTFNLWNEWVEYKNVRSNFVQWKQIVDTVGGPYISTNDNNYLAYVYADGMHRIFNDQMRLPARPSPSRSQPSLNRRQSV
jgi:hypothetical protein